MTIAINNGKRKATPEEKEGKGVGRRQGTVMA